MFRLQSYNKPASGSAAKQVALADMKPFFDYLSSSPLYTVTKRTQRTLPSLQVLVDDIMNPARINTPVAFAEALAGRIIPRSLLATPAGRQSFADAVVKGKNINVQTLSLSGVTGVLQPIAVQLYTTGPSSKNPDSGALVNSAWKTGSITLVYAQGWTSQSFLPLFFLPAPRVFSSISPATRICTNADSFRRILPAITTRSFPKASLRRPRTDQSTHAKRRMLLLGSVAPRGRLAANFFRIKLRRIAQDQAEVRSGERF